MELHELDVVLTRGNAVESHHRVHAAVVDACDRLLSGARNPDLHTWWRSCAKPFQAIPLLESGGFDSINWADKQLCLACASHGGEPEHLAVVDAMLSDLGLEEGDLACGPLEPLSARGVRKLRESGGRVTRTHNNCSGKHAAMLALAKFHDWPIGGYERPEHPVQQAMLNQVALWTGVTPAHIGVAVDGCGAAVFGLSLEQMARAYARLGTAASRGEEIPSRVVRAMSSNPFLLGGTDRFDSVMVEETNGRVITKVGADGVHSAVILDTGIGVAIKVEDGNPRAQLPAMVQLLIDLDALPDPLPPRIAEYLSKPVRNTRGETVGEMKILETTRRRVRPGTEVAAI
jgi:L-asparaginase II